MKPSHFFTLSLLVFLYLSACTYPDGSYSDSMKFAREERFLAPFDRLVFYGQGDVVITKGSDYRVEIYSELDLLDYIVTRVEENVLTIKIEGKPGYIRDLSYEIFVPQIADIEMNGSEVYSDGDLSYTGGVSVEELRIKGIRYDGRITVENLETESVFVSLDHGVISLSGVTKQIDFRTEGLGVIEAFGLLGEVGRASLEGEAGQIEIHVSDTLFIFNNSESGTVLYRGEPVVIGDTTGVIPQDTIQ